MTIEELKNYCKQNDRICPMPQYWSKLYAMLKNTKQKPSGGFEPSAPLILAAWDQPALFKQLRFFEHLDWAVKENQIKEVENFLVSLSEQNWFHLNDK